MEPLNLLPLFDLDRPEQVSLGTSLSREEVNLFLLLMQEFFDIFAWSYDDMPSIYPNMAQHYLNLQKKFKPIR